MEKGLLGWPAPDRGYNGALPDLALGIMPTCDVAYTNIGYATDGDSTTKAVAGATTMPSNFQIDLGRPCLVRRVKLVWGDLAHTSGWGVLQCSADASTWVNVKSWTNNYLTALTMDFSPTRARYWRLQTQGASGNGADITTFAIYGN